MNFQYLKQIVEDAGYEPYSYSGRGMYGRNCLSVSFERDESELDLMLEISESIVCFMEEDGEFEFEKIKAYFMGAKSDSMGLGSVVYFPSIEWEEDDDDDFEYEDEE